MRWLYGLLASCYRNPADDASDDESVRALIKQDRVLELRLRAIETKEDGLETEIAAIQKVVDKNIAKSFKTFDGPSPQETNKNIAKSFKTFVGSSPRETIKILAQERLREPRFRGDKSLAAHTADLALGEKPGEQAARAAVAALAAMLGNPDPVERFAAAEALAALGEAARPHFLDLNAQAARAAVAALAAMLGNPDPVERFAAAEALAALGEAARPHFLDLNAQAARAAVAALAAMLGNPDPVEHFAAAEALAALGEAARPHFLSLNAQAARAAVAALAAMLGNPDPVEHFAAAEALAALGEAARPHFLDLNAQAARAAVAALVEMLSAERADQGRPRAEVASQALRGLGIKLIEYAEQIVTAFSTGRVDDLALLNLAGPIKNLDVIAALLEQIYHADP